MIGSNGNGLIPARLALIGAFLPHHRQVERVVILADGPGVRRAPEWRFSDWLSGQFMTPEWIFSELMVAHGFATSAVAEQAIAEFAKIEECGWARAMLPTGRQPKPSWVVA
jgi:hypothetical protein